MQASGFAAVIPFFAIMVGGYLAGKWRVLPDGSSEVLTRFVFVVSLPALVFVSLSKVPVSEFFNWPFLGALGGGMAVMFAMGMLVARFVFPNSLTANTLHGLAAMFSSTAYIGLPLLLSLFGDRALVPGIIGAVITGVVFAPIAIIVAEVEQNRVHGKAFARPFIAAMTSPPIVATTAGLLVSGSGLVLPAPVVTLGEILGGAFVPCALFAAGLFVATCTFSGTAKEVGWLVFAKLLIHPLITWWLAYYVFELDGLLVTIAMLQAALPTGVPVFVLAQRYKTFVIQSSATIAWSTALSTVTLTILLIVLNPTD